VISTSENIYKRFFHFSENGFSASGGPAGAGKTAAIVHSATPPTNHREKLIYSLVLILI
jgi:hypothetical protein